MPKFTVLASELNHICKKVKHILNKCDKHSLDYTFDVGNEYTKLVELNQNKFELKLVDINLDVNFKLNGWHALGMVQRKDGIIQCYFKDSNLIAQYKDTDFHCDHCNKIVRRNSVVILENDNHERKVVGTSCVKEFTVGLDGNLIVEINDYLHSLNKLQSDILSLDSDNCDDATSFCTQNGVSIYDIPSVVSSAKRLIDSYGFEPSSSINATCKYILTDYNIHNIEDEAIDAINWIKSMSSDEVHKSTYLFNIRQIIDSDYCTARHFGLLASLIPSYRKSTSHKVSNHSTNNSNFVGNVGDKLSLKVVYLVSHSYDTRFGTSYIHLFSDDKGNIFKWSTGKNFATLDGHKISEGTTLELTGKVKEHDEYRNQKQTVLTRCQYKLVV